MDKLLLTPVEAARALGIGRSKVYELLSSGALDSVRIGTCRRVPAEALHSFLVELRDGGRHRATLTGQPRPPSRSAVPPPKDNQP